MDVSYANQPSLAYEDPPPYSPVRGAGEANTGSWDEKENDRIIVRITRTWTRTAIMHEAPKKLVRTTSDFFQQRTLPAIRNSATHVAPLVTSVLQSTWIFIRDRLWLPVRDYPLKVSQFWALLLLILGIGPFVVYGMLIGQPYGRFYYGAFAAKTMGCGYALGIPQNSTVIGVEALFVLDWTFGEFSFSKVKTIDVAWDILVGRGVQMIFWAISYRVFSDALLRLVERHPASFETFKSICLEGPGLGSSWVLLKQLFRNRSKRTWLLFSYLLLASSYVLSIPPLLGAMSGYDSTTIAWVSLDDDDSIIPSSQLTTGYSVYSAGGVKFDKPLCDTTTGELRDWYYHQMDMQDHCDCRLPDGEILPFTKWQRQYYNQERPSEEHYNLDDCKFRYDGQVGTYQSGQWQYARYDRAKDWGQLNCNDSFPITLTNGKSYSVYDIVFDSYGYCFQNISYDYMGLVDSTRCLPDTAHPSYQWGFSSAMIGVCFIINLVWCLTMWVVWQDALRSDLVRCGYRMSPLRAAFVLTEAARKRTGLDVDSLVQRERRLLRKELKRRKGRREAMVDKAIFEERAGDDEVVHEKGDVATIKRRPIRREESEDGPV